MVSYETSDLIAMSDFDLSWRITDSRWASLPKSTLDRIKPLSLAKSREVYEVSPLSEQRVRFTADLGPFRATRHQSLEASGSPEDGPIQTWFRGLPIERKCDVYVCWSIGEGVAAITDWGTFLEVWDDLWYPFDRMCVFDDTREWAVCFGPDEDVSFLEIAVSQSRT